MAAPFPFGDQIYVDAHLLNPIASINGTLEWSDDSGTWAGDGMTATPDVTNAPPQHLTLSYAYGAMTYTWRMSFDYQPPSDLTHYIWKEDSNFQTGPDDIIRPSGVQLDMMRSALVDTGVMFQHAPTALGPSVIFVTAAGTQTLPFAPGYGDFENLVQTPPEYWLVQMDNAITLTQLFFIRQSLIDSSNDYMEFTRVDGEWEVTSSLGYDADGNPVGESQHPVLEWESGPESWPDPDLSTPGFGRSKGFSHANGHRKNTGFKKSQGF